MIGAFCETYGNTILNRVWQFLMETQEMDFAISDVAEDVCISRPKAYQVMEEFENKNYVKKSRVVGKTQLYRLNKENPIVKIFIRNFKECLMMVAEEYDDFGDLKKASEQVAKKHWDNKADAVWDKV